MITFPLNGEKQVYEGDPNLTLLKFLRNEKPLVFRETEKTTFWY